MDEKKNINEEIHTNDTSVLAEPLEAAEETAEAVPAEVTPTVETAAEPAAGEAAGAEEKPKRGKRFKNALIAACALTAAAAILLAVTGFGFVSLLKGPQEVYSLMDNPTGSFVKYQNFAIVGIYGEEVSPGGDTTGLYALAPVSGELVTIHYTQRYVESANTIYNETSQVINGTLSNLDHYVNVQGTMGVLDTDAEAMMYDWFGENKDMLVSAGVVADTDDYADCLTEQVLLVDTVGGVDQTLVIVLSAIAAAMLLAAIVLLILLALGVFHDKPKMTGETEDETEDAPTVGTPTEETPAEDAPAEDAPAEDAPAEETTTDETSAGEASVEEVPTEEAPAEDTPAGNEKTEDGV